MWDLRSDARLSKWREFRQSLNNLPLYESLQKVSTLWSFAPFVNTYLDPRDTTDWPDPWELLHENHYCDLAKCLGMFYTIALSKHGQDCKLALSVLKYKKKKEYINIVSVNNTHVLNYEFNSIVNRQTVSKSFQYVYNYTEDELNIASYC